VVWSFLTPIPTNNYCNHNYIATILLISGPSCKVISRTIDLYPPCYSTRGGYAPKLGDSFPSHFLHRDVSRTCNAAGLPGDRMRCVMYRDEKLY